MEEEKVAKKSKIPMILMVAAVVLILAGVGLIMTGNNKSFIGKDEPNEPKESDEQITEQLPDNTENEPPRVVVPITITNEEVLQLINERKQLDFPEETWQAQSVVIVGHDSENEKYLVSYDEIDELGNITKKQTIVTVFTDSKYVELPGWNEGERDLTVYNFIMDSEMNTNDSNVTTPVEPSPTESTNPTEPTESTDLTGQNDQTVPDDIMEEDPYGVTEPIEEIDDDMAQVDQTDNY